MIKSKSFNLMIVNKTNCRNIFERAYHEQVGASQPIDNGFREEQSEITEWQNLYDQRTIIVLGAGLKGEANKR